MRRTITIPFLLLGLFLFCWINMPKTLSDRIRSTAMFPFTYRTVPSHEEELAKLQLENQILRTQVDHIYERLLFDQKIAEQFDFLKGLEQRTRCQKQAARLREVLQNQLTSLPAQVIYRVPSSWSSSLWVNVGEDDNVAIGRTLVAKNSPVLADGALVGVVDYVGKKQARIHLITDSGLSPAVRVVRGATSNRDLAHQIQILLNKIEKQEELKGLATELKSLREKLGVDWEDGYLAKGEVQGSSAPFWRSRSPLLKGIGFNFDYPDEDAPPLKKQVPLIKEGDLLVTSGLDGVFPPGLRVGTVLSIEPLKEGGYAYDIKVRPSVSNLNDLTSLFILPPLEGA